MLPQPPVATNVKVMQLIDKEFIPVTGTIKSYIKLYGIYEYDDANNDPEDISIYRWYRSDSDDPNGEYSIINKSNGEPHDLDTYTPNDYDVGKYIVFEVTPVQQLLLDKLETEENRNVSIGTLINIVTS